MPRRQRSQIDGAADSLVIERRTDTGNRPAPKYLPSVPTALKTFHEARLAARLQSDSLARLLTDRRMERPWKELARRIGDDSRWHALLAAIDHAGDEVADHPRATKSAERRRFQRMAVRARLLALDLDAVWPGIKVAELSAEADPALTIGTLLRSFAHEVEEEADRIGESRRLIERRTTGRRGEQMVKAYVKALVLEFRRFFGQPLYGTVASVAAVMLQRPSIDKAFVERAARRPPKGPR